MGCVAVVLAAYNHLIEAGIFMALGIFFDFFDGLAARMLNVSSEMGKQLDSLADVVTSGVVPGIVMFQLLNAQNIDLSIFNNAVNVEWFAYLGFLITLGSAYRLAKFNIDENQSDKFIGLPTPANAILILSIPFIIEFGNQEWLSSIFKSELFLIPLTLFSVIALNMNIELFSLKLKSLSFKENKLIFLFLIASLVLLILLKFLAIPLIILSYILVSILFKKNTAKN